MGIWGLHSRDPFSIMTVRYKNKFNNTITIKGSESESLIRPSDFK